MKKNVLVELYGRGTFIEFCQIEASLFIKLKNNEVTTRDEELDLWDELPGGLFAYVDYDPELYFNNVNINVDNIIEKLGVKEDIVLDPFDENFYYWVRIFDAKAIFCFGNIENFDETKLKFCTKKIVLPNRQVLEGLYLDYPNFEFEIGRENSEIKEENSYVYDTKGNEFEIKTEQ